MNETSKKNGSGVFDEFVAGQEQPSNAFVLSSARPPRVSFAKPSGEKLSIAYARVDVVRWVTKEISIVVGENRIRVTGRKLRSLFDALHTERASAVMVSTSEADADSLDETVVTEISWDGELEY